MLFGSDWLANFYLGCFLFGLIFTALSLVLNVGHLGSGHAHVSHSFGHALQQIGHASHGPHVAGNGHAAPPPAHPAGHTVSAGEHVDALSPLNLPTLMAFLTWFGGAGYIYRTVLGLGGLLSAVLALAGGLVGGAIVSIILTRVLWPGQTAPLSRADFYLPGTRARVVSAIGANGTGEIVFFKGGSRRVEGARGEWGEAIPKGTEVVIVRYDKGLAYVQALAPIPAAAIVPAPRDSLAEASTQPLDGNGAAVTRDLHIRQ